MLKDFALTALASSVGLIFVLTAGGMLIRKVNSSLENVSGLGA